MPQPKHNATQMLQGKVLSHVEYQTPEETQDFDWTKRAPVIVFTDGSRLLPIADDEMNEAGAMMLTSERLVTS
jgi:hypothetical protein